MGTLQYKVIKRANPVNGSIKFYASKSMYKNLDSEDTYAAIAENTQMSKTQVIQAVGAIVKTITNFVMNGHTVQIPQLGAFRTTIQGSADWDCTSAKDYDIAKCAKTKVCLRFLPCSEIKNAADSTNFIVE